MVAPHLFRGERRQAQQPVLYLAVKLGRLRLAGLHLRPEPLQGALQPGCGVWSRGAVQGGGLHDPADRMIGRQQVE